MKENIQYSKSAPSIACIGGGTGLSTMLRGLKRFTPNITAIVTVADDGGGSGILRNELGILPPGDIRSCIEALSNTEPTMKKLLNYRFEDGRLKGQSFGNLFLAALNGITGSFDQAVAKMCEVLAITGRVLPVTTENVQIEAEFEDGGTVIGESHIGEEKSHHNCRIKKIRLLPENPAALPESIRAISEADLIILGPGSLYTSIIPNLLVSGIVDAISASSALRLYICNIMTQDGESEGYTVADHIEALFRHSGCRIFDMCLANTNFDFPEALLAKYEAEGAGIIVTDRERISKLGVELFEAPVAGKYKTYIRHDPQLLAREIIKIYRAKSPTRLYGG